MSKTPNDLLPFLRQYMHADGSGPVAAYEKIGVDKYFAAVEKELDGIEREVEGAFADHRNLVRELDVLLNGEAGAARQASLCDIVAQVRLCGLCIKVPAVVKP
jgi:hypothetical protein